MDAEVGNFPAVSGRTTHALIFSSRLTILSIWTQDLGPQFLQANFQTPADLLGAIGFRMKSILCDQQHLFQTDPQVGLNLLQPQYFIPLQAFVLSQELQVETKIMVSFISDINMYYFNQSNLTLSFFFFYSTYPYFPPLLENAHWSQMFGIKHACVTHTDQLSIFLGEKKNTKKN